MARNLQVLIVDADLEHRAAVKQALAGRAYAVVGEAQYGVEAAYLAMTLQPDIVLIHVEEPLALALRTLDGVQRAAPQATPIVISRRTDGETARKVVLAGARGYVLSPATADDLDRVLGEAHQRSASWLAQVSAAARGESVSAMPQVSGMVVTVFGPKGGVGKTTLTTNLAIALRQQTDARVVVVDADTMFGDIAISLGIEPERTIGECLADIESGQAVDVDQYLALHHSGVAVLGTRHGIRGIEASSAETLSQLLRTLAARYDFVIIDTPGTLNPYVAAALDAATTALLVTSADMASVKDARMAVDLLRSDQFDADRLKLIVNHATNANSVTNGDIARVADCEVFWNIPHDRIVPLSTQRGEPAVLLDRRARVSREVEALAHWFSGQPAVSGGASHKKRSLFWWN